MVILMPSARHIGVGGELSVRGGRAIHRCADYRVVDVEVGLHATNTTRAIKPKNIALILDVNNFSLRKKIWYFDSHCSIDTRRYADIRHVQFADNGTRGVRQQANFGKRKR